MEVNTIAHYETLCGLDGAGDDEDGGDSLSAGGLTMDQAGAAAANAGAPVVTSELAIAAIDSFVSNLRSSGLRGGRMMRSALGEQNSLVVPYGNVVASVASGPHSSAISAELQEINTNIAQMRLTARDSCDSDFEEEVNVSPSTPPCEERKEVMTPSSLPRSSGIDQLSRSTMDLIGELVARKANRSLN
jgi:hypothetical protein